MNTEYAVAWSGATWRTFAPPEVATAGPKPIVPPEYATASVEQALTDAWQSRRTIRDVVGLRQNRVTHCLTRLVLQGRAEFLSRKHEGSGRPQHFYRRVAR